MASSDRQVSREIAANIEIEQVPSGDIYTRIAPNDLPAFALALCALEHEIIKDVVLVDPPKAVSIAVDHSLASTARGELLGYHGDWVTLAVSPTELNYWQVFFLRAWSDGAAAVDHIDLDIPRGPSAMAGLFVKVIANQSNPPLTAEEARERLGS